MTRQYIRNIRHEYEGGSREAVEHYLDVINKMCFRVTEYCIRNIKENYPVFNSFLQDIEDEYIALVTEGGFSEAEVYDYVYGNESNDVPYDTCEPFDGHSDVEEVNEDASADADTDAAATLLQAIAL